MLSYAIVSFIVEIMKYLDLDFGNFVARIWIHLVILDNVKNNE